MNKIAHLSVFAFICYFTVIVVIRYHIQYLLGTKALENWDEIPYLSQEDRMSVVAELDEVRYMMYEAGRLVSDE